MHLCAEATYIPIPNNTLATGGNPGLVGGSFGAALQPPGGTIHFKPLHCAVNRDVCQIAMRLPILTRALLPYHIDSNGSECREVVEDVHQRYTQQHKCHVVREKGHILCRCSVKQWPASDWPAGSFPVAADCDTQPVCLAGVSLHAARGCGLRWAEHSGMLWAAVPARPVGWWLLCGRIRVHVRLCNLPAPPCCLAVCFITRAGGLRRHAASNSDQCRHM